MSRLFPGNTAMIEQARALYVLIRQKDGVTRQYLGEELAMPATSLNRALERQLSAGLIEEYDLAASTGGRRPGLYRIVDRAFYLLGLDLSGAAGLLVLADLSLRIIGQVELPALEILLQQDLCAALLPRCQALLAAHNLQAGQVLGLGVGWTAVRGNESDDDEPRQAPDPLAACWPQLAAALQLPVYPVRGADAALYAGLWQQRELSGSTFIYFSVGQSVRFGLALHGQLHPGNLSTDSIGQLLVPLPDRPGGHHLDQIAAIPAMTRRYQRAKDDDSLNWADFCQAVGDGKRKAGLILADAAFAMATAMQNMALITGGTHILPGGPALYDLPAYDDAIRQQAGLLARKSGIKLDLLVNPYGRSLLATGAAAFVLENSLGANPPGNGRARPSAAIK